jgi:hypothetical protein
METITMLPALAEVVYILPLALNTQLHRKYRKGVHTRYFMAQAIRALLLHFVPGIQEDTLNMNLRSNRAIDQCNNFLNRADDLGNKLVLLSTKSVPLCLPTTILLSKSYS